MSTSWPWIALLLLGAYHGINPGMGWLFAVALGLQEKSSRAVIKALLPVALGHAASIAVIVIIVGLAQRTLSESILRQLSAAVLFAFGIYRLIRSRHPRWVGMRVDFKDLTLWSFLMSSAHGAGLMLVPILLKWPAMEHAPSHTDHTQPLQQIGDSSVFLFASVFVHTLSMFLMMGLVAILVYERFGLAILRTAWFNLDLLWVLALFVAGIMALVL
jgi:hypothetical protein